MTVNGYDDENGLKLLMSELDPNDWNQMAMIWSHMQDLNLLRQLVQRRVLLDLIQYDKKDMSDVFSF